MKTWPKLFSLLFLPCVGVTYATGFLVVLISLETFGIRESGMEFWKGRYIHIGILALALPVIINCAIYPLWIIRSERHRLQSTDILPSRIIPGILLFLNLQVLTFIVLMISRPGYSGFWPLFKVFLLTVFGSLFVFLVQQLFDRFPKDAIMKESLKTNVTICLRWALFAVVVLFYDTQVLIIFWDLVKEIAEFHSTAFVSLTLLILLLGLLPVIGKYFLDKYQSDRMPQSTTAVKALVISIIAPLLYFFIITFAHLIYPYMPATRGGNDFTEARKIVIFFRPTTHLANWPDILDSTKRERSIPLIVITETSSSLFLANPGDAGGPMEWRRNAKSRPVIIEVPKDQLSHSVIQENPIGYIGSK